MSKPSDWKSGLGLVVLFAALSGCKPPDLGCASASCQQLGDGRTQCSNAGNAACAPGIVTGPRSVAAFQAADDMRCHAVIARACGDVVDIAHDCQGGSIQKTTVAHLDRPTAVSAYYDAASSVRRVLIGTAGGDLYELRLKTGLTPTPIRLTNVAAPILSLSAWLDPKGNQNVVLLTGSGLSRSLQLYRAPLGQPGTLQPLAAVTDAGIVDVAGEHLSAGDLNQIQIATLTGTRSALSAMWWASASTPGPTTIHTSNSATPWVANFPGPDAPPEAVVSLAGVAGVGGDYVPWAAALVLVLVNSNSQLRLFGVGQTGGRLAATSATPPSLVAAGAKFQAVSAPFFWRANLTQLPRFEVATVTSDNHVLAGLEAIPSSGGEAAWSWADLGTF